MRGLTLLSYGMNPDLWSNRRRLLYIGDFNGDGNTDIILQNKAGYDASYLLIADGNGGFQSRKEIRDSYGMNPDLWSNQRRLLYAGDFNGDGETDLILQNKAGYGAALQLLADIPFQDLLASLSNGVGGTTTITYKPSSQYENDVFPLILQTVSSISVDDGNGNTSTTDYTYAGGLFDFGTRELRGFEYVKTTDPSGTTSESWFHQDEVFKGLPYKTEIKDSSGNLYSKSEKTFSSTSPYTGVDFPYLEQSNDYVYDGTATANEVSTTFAYDAYGNITEKHLGGDTAISGDERDEYIEYNYDTTNWLVSLPDHTYVNNSTGTKVSEAWFAYDANGNLLTETTWNDSGPDPVITYTYDNYGNQESIKDPNNLNTSKTTNITYDSTHTFPYQATNPLGHTATTVYDPGIGKVISETGPNGNTTTYDYDVFGRMTKVANPLDTGSQYGTASYEYLDCGTANLRVVTYSTEESGTANHIRSEVCLDGLERTVKTWKDGPDGKTIVADIEYDSTGRVFRKSLPYFEVIGTPRWMTYTYDPVGRVTQITNPDGTFVTTSYDKDTTTFIDANDHKKVEIKDVYGRLIKVEEYTGTGGAYSLYATTIYEYNALGNLVMLTDDHGNQTTMTYDTLGRKLTMDDPDMGVWSYTYDLNGNLTSQTDAKQKTTNFTYDDLNRVTFKDNPTDPDITYDYDEIFSTNPKGRLTTLTDASGITKYYYDQLGRTLKTIKTVDGTDYTTQTTYDALSRTKSLTYPDNETVNYTYDTGGNLSSVPGYATYSGYNALGQIDNITYGNGVTTAYSYETDTNRLSTIVTETSAGTGLLNLSYDYDNTDNIEHLTDNLDGTHTQTFTYDDLDRLTDAYSDNYGLLTYTYDTIGNIKSKRGVSYTYGGPRPHAVTETNGGTSASDRAFVYNDENKPSSINYNGEDTAFVYSGVWSSHNRAEKQTDGPKTIYIGGLYEKRGNAVTKYIFAGGTRVAVKTSTETYYYHQDHLSSTRVVTNSSGNQVEEIHYYPYGETLSDTGTVSVKHKFTSQELDSETGLYYYGARCYDPVLGKFTTADSIVPDPTNPQSLNRYSYVLNNPLKYTDPSGHWGFSSIFKGAKKLLKSAGKAIKSALSKPVVRFAIAAVITYVTYGAASAYLGGLTLGGEAALLSSSQVMLASATIAGATGYANYAGYPGFGGYASYAGSSGESGGYYTDGGTAISASSSGGDIFEPATREDVDAIINSITPQGRVNAGIKAGKGALNGIKRLWGLLRGKSAINYSRLKSLGRPGKGKGVREIIGNEKDARKLFDQLRVSNPVIEVKQGVFLSKAENGGIITFRAASKSGPPTVDIHGLEIGVRKFKFLPE